jgi:hypothetical protein
MTDKLIDSSFASTDELLTAYWQQKEELELLRAQMAAMWMNGLVRDWSDAFHRIGTALGLEGRFLVHFGYEQIEHEAGSLAAKLTSYAEAFLEAGRLLGVPLREASDPRQQWDPRAFYEQMTAAYTEARDEREQLRTELTWAKALILTLEMKASLKELP